MAIIRRCLNMFNPISSIVFDFIAECQDVFPFSISQHICSRGIAQKFADALDTPLSGGDVYEHFFKLFICR